MNFNLFNFIVFNFNLNFKNRDIFNITFCYIKNTNEITKMSFQY